MARAHELGNNLVHAALKLLYLSKKIGLIGGDKIDNFFELFARLTPIFYNSAIVCEVGYTQSLKPRAQASLDDKFEAVDQTDAAMFVHKLAQAQKVLAGQAQMLRRHIIHNDVL